MNFDNEELFLNEVEKCLKENGCKTWREVVPDGCSNWGLPFRVDLIIFREDFGYIGVEAKNTNTLRSGGKIAKAIKQINDKYRNQTYFKGNMISRWCVLVPTKTIWDNEEHGDLICREILIFLRGFLQEHNVFLLEYSPETQWRKSKVSIGAYTKEKIEIGGNNLWNP